MNDNIENAAKLCAEKCASDLCSNIWNLSKVELLTPIILEAMRGVVETTESASHMALVNRLKADEAKPSDRWIPVSERLPEKCVRVLGYFNDFAADPEDITIVKRYDDNSWADDHDVIDQIPVKWQPLPDAPRTIAGGTEPSTAQGGTSPTGEPGDGWPDWIGAGLCPSGKKVTVAELKAILDDPAPRKIVVNPDGSISASRIVALQEQVRVLREAGDPFGRVCAMMDGLNIPDNAPMSKWIPGAWPDMKDCRAMRQALHATAPAEGKAV